MISSGEIVYLLELQNNKWYVGKTAKFVPRMDSHVSGQGAHWVRKHLPLVSSHVLGTYSATASWEETKQTLLMMKKYGLNNVRGAEYCQLRDFTEDDCERMSYAAIHHLECDGRKEIENAFRNSLNTTATQSPQFGSMSNATTAESPKLGSMSNATTTESPQFGNIFNATTTESPKFGNIFNATTTESPKFGNIFNASTTQSPSRANQSNQTYGKRMDDNVVNTVLLEELEKLRLNIAKDIMEVYAFYPNDVLNTIIQQKPTCRSKLSAIINKDKLDPYDYEFIKPFTASINCPACTQSQSKNVDKPFCYKCYKIVDR